MSAEPPDPRLTEHAFLCQHPGASFVDLDPQARDEAAREWHEQNHPARLERRAKWEFGLKLVAIVVAVLTLLVKAGALG
jgi:hypothetical protein